MKAAANDIDILKAVRPSDLATYLRARHWVTEEEPYDNREWFWTLGDRPSREHELLMPLRQDFKDYHLRVGEALEMLELAENRPLGDILRDVITATYDVVQVKVDNPRYQDGSLKLDDGVTLFENARKMLASAARSAYEPRPQFVAGMPREVNDYLEKVRVGQTERGSYIVNILSPTVSSIEQDQLFSTEPYRQEDSFELRVVRTLSRALEATHRAAVESVRAPLQKTFEGVVPVGVSANLCEAIAKIGQSGGNTGMEVRLRGALSRPIDDEVHRAVYFSAVDIPLIEEAGKLLRSTHSREERIEGYVVRLSRERGLGEEGTIAVQSIVEDKLRRITVELRPAAYQRAVRAHEEDQRVALYGKLERKGRSFYLRDLRRLEVLAYEED